MDLGLYGIFRLLLLRNSTSVPMLVIFAKLIFYFRPCKQRCRKTSNFTKKKQEQAPARVGRRLLFQGPIDSAYHDFLGAAGGLYHIDTGGEHVGGCRAHALEHYLTGHIVDRAGCVRSGGALDEVN